MGCIRSILEKEALLSRGARFLIVFLFVLVVLSLALNGYLIWQWLTFRSQALALANQQGRWPVLTARRQRVMEIRLRVNYNAPASDKEFERQNDETGGEA